MVMGVGMLFLYLLVFVYIDENVYLKLCLVYFGVFFVVVIVGFGLGFFVVGVMFINYVDLEMVSF